MFQALIPVRIPVAKSRDFAGACPSTLSRRPSQPREIETVRHVMARRQQQPVAMGAAHRRFDPFDGPAVMPFQKCPHLIPPLPVRQRSEEHTTDLQSLMRISYAVFCLTKKTQTIKNVSTE